MNRETWKYFHRLQRCTMRAMQEGFERRMCDMAIYGTAFYTPEEQEKDMEMVVKLMAGLRP